MSDFTLLTSRASHSASTWDAVYSNPPWLANMYANRVSFNCGVQQMDTDLLTQGIKLLSNLLHEHASQMTDKQVSQIMRYIAELDESREEAELAANPARKAGIERAGQRFAKHAEKEIVHLFSLV